MSEKRSEISQLGEFGLIDRISSNVKLINPSSLKGIGDDAAVIHAAEHCLLISTDMLVEGIHFDLSYVPFISIFRICRCNIWVTKRWQ